MLSAILSANGKVLWPPLIATTAKMQTSLAAAKREKVALANARSAVGLAHLEVDKVEAQLANVLVHGPNLQLAVLHVTRHDRRKVGRHNVRDVVDDFLVTGCHDCNGSWW